MATHIDPSPAGTAPVAAPLPAALSALLFGDVEEELAATRRMLERYPEEHADWSPHERSGTLQRLAAHVAQLPRFAATILESEEWDMLERRFPQETARSREEILALFEASAAGLREAIAATDLEALGREWRLRRGDHVFASGRKATVVRRLGLTHMAHHRAQIGVYYRLLGLPVPGMHGPSADEI